MKKMQHCFWCGEELGVYDSRETETCGKSECNREARRMDEADRYERHYRAEEDDYDRYR
jgi:hypothetical protein